MVVRSRCSFPLHYSAVTRRVTTTSAERLVVLASSKLNAKGCVGFYTKKQSRILKLSLLSLTEKISFYILDTKSEINSLRYHRHLYLAVLMQYREDITRPCNIRKCYKPSFLTRDIRGGQELVGRPNILQQIEHNSSFQLRISIGYFT